MLRYGLPRYRLSKGIIDDEINLIREMGVEFKTGVELGTDITVEDLKAQGYNSIFLAVGAGQPDRLDLEGGDARGVIDARGILMAVSKGEDISLGRTVAVVGRA